MRAVPRCDGCPIAAASISRTARSISSSKRAAIEAAYAAAARRLDGLLDELCEELPALRRAVGAAGDSLRGPVARRMEDAVAPLAARGFVTPMAAVAGAVADEILAAMVAATGHGLSRAYVNNGGDIALHLGEGQRFAIGLIDRPDHPSLFASAAIEAGDGVAGVATSGARGRSFSLGIADAVTILAGTAAEADAAATVVANAVDLPGDPRIVRAPANSLQPDSDLGAIPVTRSVPPLDRAEIERALRSGAAVAERLIQSGRIAAAALHLQGRTLFAGSTSQARLEAAPALGASRSEARFQGDLHA
jgi:uncharacterized protein